LKKNIFKDIRTLIFKNENNHLNIGGDRKKAIENFLAKPSFRTATNLFNSIRVHHKKHTIFKLMSDLKLYEDGFKDILPDHREHYLHSASVYVLGLAIYNSSEKIRNSLDINRGQYWGEDEQKELFQFRWALTACLHDIAYPLEIALKSLNNYAELLHDSGINFINIDPNIYYNLAPLEPDQSVNLTERKDSIKLIADNIIFKKNKLNTKINSDGLFTLLREHLDKNLSEGRIDHGVLSALITMKHIHKLYKDNGWDMGDFDFHVVESATAIFLHNTYKHSGMIDIFGTGKYYHDQPSPLGFLLFLCDTLCEWSRGKVKDAIFYGITVKEDNNIIMKVPRNKEDKLKKDLIIIDPAIPVKIVSRWPKNKSIKK